MVVVVVIVVVVVVVVVIIIVIVIFVIILVSGSPLEFVSGFPLVVVVAVVPSNQATKQASNFDL